VIGMTKPINVLGIAKRAAPAAAVQRVPLVLSDCF